MIFCTYWFILFCAIYFPLYWLVKKPSWRLALLLLFSAIFHTHFAGPAGVIPIVILALITYGAALAAEKIRGSEFETATEQQKKTAGWICIAAMSTVAGALVTYKYYKFILLDWLGLVNQPLGDYFAASMYKVMPEAPPLAISFFAFEFIHYLFEVRRGGKAIKAPQQFATFAIFFPSLVAGPIKRYQDFLPSLQRGLAHTGTKEVSTGLLVMSMGFFKKLILADNINQFIIHKETFFNVMDMWERWLFLLALAGRIYYDFSGYTDIALGLAMMMGIALPQNFNRPYGANSIQEFWQRWHMSLSFWIRDYIYIPLGGSKHGVPRRIFNGLFAFALCGMWHGASWNFIFWGLYHGIGLTINTLYRKIPALAFVGKFFDKVPLAARLFTFLFVCFGWLSFFYPLDRAWQMALLLFGQAQLVEGAR